ncbi:acyl-CoA N-acyltransferase [Anaeromyces robustus]|uniref:Acyl-CoA N-acyltransferase n=1 Tax=Anaeromyces robustus TaxID=1754192 RepID=A0A1Y1X2S7_9FUNG|nr:acyl-CoA N-acyltransferase [Anaeromyces robustus]|eukprot:ORX80101.1 acyl-CoA N-acyltransferase [Anaeromyces robustus]
MLNDNSQPEIGKPISYSKILLKNLKKENDNINKQENNNFNINDNTDKLLKLNSFDSKTSLKSIIKEVSLEKTKSNENKKITPVLRSVNRNNINDLRKVYISTFPLTYNNEFYSDIINIYPKGLSRVATYHNIVVGGICCRLEKKTLKDIKRELPIPSVGHDLSFTQQISQLNDLKLLNTYSCYIMAIAVLELYQNLSIGSKLMSYIIKYCENDKSISSINLHVHVKNEKAIKFYKKYGFYQKEYIKNYYFNNPNIIPPDVYYFQKDLY